MINIAEPQIGRPERWGISNVLDSGILAQGKRVADFEQAFAEYVGADHAVAVGNGTQALYLSLLGIGIGEGDIVETTPFTFASTATSILMTGASVRFCDVDPETFNIDATLLDVSDGEVDAILPVHLYGLPSDVTRAAHEIPVPVIFDACQAHGAEVDGVDGIGSVGAASCWSFYATKNMTTGEGGMVTTNNDRLADKLRRLRNHGQADQYDYVELGYNCRMTNIQAAIGLAQLTRLPEMLEHRTALAAFYNANLRDDVLDKPTVPDGYTHAWHQYTVQVRQGRDDLLAHLHAEEVGARIYYPIPLHNTTLFRRLMGDQSFPVAEELSRRVLSLPIHPGVSFEDANLIVQVVNAWQD